MVSEGSPSGSDVHPGPTRRGIMTEASRARRGAFHGTAAVVCGGSKGIGKATAVEIARGGGSVCLIARDATALRQAAEEVGRAAADGQRVETLVCDTTDERAVGSCFGELFDRVGPPDYLLNVVGSAYPQYFEQLTLADYKTAMEGNFFGQLVPTLATLPRMLEAGRGHVAFTSSVLGYMGAMGYAGYAPSKYALVGLAESLRSELSHRGIGFSVLFPPDTDTPGFEKENETKPEEWLVSDAAKLLRAEDVGRAFAEGLAKGRFRIMPGQAAWMWRIARFSPRLLHKLVDREYAAARRKLGKA